MTAISASGSLACPRGICGAPSSRATALYNKDAAARPATTASPEDPPFKTPAYVSRFNPDRISTGRMTCKASSSEQRLHIILVLEEAILRERASGSQGKGADPQT